MIQNGGTTHPAFAPLTYKSLSPFQFSANDIKNTTNKLDPVEAVARRCSAKEVFLEISQNLQENTWAEVSFLIKSAKFSF